jgi:IS30 family transposase
VASLHPSGTGDRCARAPAEREEIFRGLATGESLRAIATRLGRSASTVCREVNRNGGRNRYRATRAEEKAWHRARRPKRKYPSEEAMHVSHETIYRTLFVQAKGALKRELLAHLRSRRLMRSGRHASTRGNRVGRSRRPSPSASALRR